MNNTVLNLKPYVNVTTDIIEYELSCQNLYDKNKVTKIILSENAILPTHVFEGYTSLQEVWYSELLEEIPDYAFSGCKNLWNMRFDNCKKIGRYAFDNCVLTNIISLNKNCILGEGAFVNCSNITEVWYSELLEEIPDYAFSGCKNLWNMRFDNCKKIGRYAFDGCKSLNDVIAPMCYCIGDYAFKDSAISTLIAPNCYDININALSNTLVYNESI